MYDYLTRAEVLRLALRLFCYALAGVGSAVGAVFAFWSVVSAPYGISDVLKLARLSCFALACFAVCVWWWSIGDALRSAAFLSFRRGLYYRGKGGNHGA